MDTKFFCNDDPKEKEIVQVIFTERNDIYASGYLVDYNCDVVMDIENVIKRKKRKLSVNKVIPINKIVVAVLEDFDKNKKTGTVDISYISRDDTEHIEKFKNNFKLKNSLFHICEVQKISFTDFWQTVVYPFIKTCNNGEYLDFFIKHYNELDLNDDIKTMIKERFETEINNIRYKKNVSIVSTGGVELVKKLFDDTIVDFSNITIRYISTPNYLIESDNEEQLNNFVNVLVTNKPENVFVKI